MIASQWMMLLLLAAGSAAWAQAPKPHAAPANEQRELDQHMEAERTAVASGDASAIITRCRELVAYALAQLGDLRISAGDTGEAISFYKSSLAAVPSTRIQLDLAAALIRSKQVDAGQELATGVLEAEPANPRALALLKGKVDAPHAAAPLPASLATEGRLRRDLALAYTDWGTAVIRQQGDYAGALLLFDAAMHWDPTAPGAARSQALAAFRLGKYEKSAAAWRTVLVAQPADKEAHVLLGLSLFSLRQFPEAAQAFAPAAASVMDNPRAAYAWAFSLAHAGEPQQSNRILDALSAKPLPADQRMLVCQVYEQTENYEHAITCLKQVIAEQPSAKQAHSGIGVSLIHLSRPAEAVPELEQELALDPENPQVRFYYAYALLATSRKPEAQAILTRLVAEAPGDSKAQYELGKLLAEQGKWPEAIAHLQAAADTADPTDYDVHYQLQNAYRRNGQTEQAARELAVYKAIKAGSR
ncbi:MAG TPA: tetratricopeptide repeat protein [Acidobacteriaceae bacterium]